MTGREKMDVNTRAKQVVDKATRETREEGLYWVQNGGEWEVARWSTSTYKTGGVWLLIGQDEGFGDELLDAIGPRLADYKP